MMPKEQTAQEWIDDLGPGDAGNVTICSRNEVIREGYGLEVVRLTPEHLAALKEGRALEIGIMGEYGCLIYLDDGELER